jgi:ribonuclease BN (tRNA processing enzyme)
MYVPAVETYVRGQIAKGRPVSFEAYLAHMKADHAPVEDVGRIAAEAGVKTLVLSHLTPAIDSISDDTWRAPAAKYFGGEIVVAHDLMVL